MSGVFRHPRHRFVCWTPRADTTGLWPVWTWMFWTWEQFPEAIGEQIAGYCKVLRGKA
jgi:hypothetical protein